jgi:hypothetical protein
VQYGQYPIQQQQDPLVLNIYEAASQILTSYVNAHRIDQALMATVNMALRNGINNVYAAVAASGVDGHVTYEVIYSIVKQIIDKKIMELRAPHMNYPQYVNQMGGGYPQPGYAGGGGFVPSGYAGGGGMIPDPGIRGGFGNIAQPMYSSSSVFSDNGILDVQPLPDQQEEYTTPVETARPAQSSGTTSSPGNIREYTNVITKELERKDERTPQLCEMIPEGSDQPIATCGSVTIPISMPGPNAAAEYILQKYPTLENTTHPVFLQITYPKLSVLQADPTQLKNAMKEITAICSDAEMAAIDQIKTLETVMADKPIVFQKFIMAMLADRVNQTTEIGCADIITIEHPDAALFKVDDYADIRNMLSLSRISQAADSFGDFLKFQTKFEFIVKAALASIAETTLLDPSSGPQSFLHRDAVLSVAGFEPDRGKVNDEYCKLIAIQSGQEIRKEALDNIKNIKNYAFFKHDTHTLWTNVIPYDIIEIMGLTAMSKVREPELVTLPQESKLGSPLLYMLNAFNAHRAMRIVAHCGKDINIHFKAGLTANRIIQFTTTDYVRKK